MCVCVRARARVCVFVSHMYTCVCLSVCLSVCLYVCMYVCINLSFYLSIYLSKWVLVCWLYFFCCNSFLHWSLPTPIFDTLWYIRPFVWDSHGRTHESNCPLLLPCQNRTNISVYKRKHSDRGVYCQLCGFAQPRSAPLELHKATPAVRHCTRRERQLVGSLMHVPWPTPWRQI